MYSVHLMCTFLSEMQRARLTHSKGDGGDDDLHAVVRPVCLHLLPLLLRQGCMVVAAHPHLFQANSICEKSKAVRAPCEEKGLPCNIM